MAKRIKTSDLLQKINNISMEASDIEDEESDQEDIETVYSDKGNNTVVMKKEEYLNEMHKMLQNKDIYQVLNKDPTSRFEKLANNLITKLRKESIITEKVEKSMKSYNSVAPKIYGLRKTHKQNLALRPVIACGSNDHPDVTLFGQVYRLLYS
ncbi:hypothetical protein M0804_013763 [Polistes exclamans]|nr:hypothetical protein M0804_013763 [Polistes exclamans]